MTVGAPKTAKLPNPLLLPVEVGKPKPSAMVLPPPDHVYGMKSDLDCEGAGAVMGGWMESSPNAASVPGKDFMKLNRMAINAGQGLTANQISDFRKRHDARLKGGQHGKGDGGHISLPSSQDPAFAYGIKSQARIPMEALMQNEYQNQWIAQQGKKDDQYLNAKQKIPVMHTRASLGHRYVEPPVVTQKPFKLKKFANVPGKLKSAMSAAT